MYNATDYYFLYSPVDQRRDDVIVQAGLAFLIVIMSRQLRHVNIVETKQKGRYFSFFVVKRAWIALRFFRSLWWKVKNCELFQQ